MAVSEITRETRERLEIGGDYLVAVEEEHPGNGRGRKTRVWAIHSRSQGAMLGWVRWHSAWRQYVFEPQGDYGAYVIFNAGCLDDIASFLRAALREQRSRKAVR